MEPSEIPPETRPHETDQRMAALALFTDGLVHDLRNPLNVIRTNVYLLRQRIPEEDVRSGRAIDRIDDQVSAAMRLLDGVQAFYRADRPAMQRLNVNEVVQAVASSLSLPETCSVETDLAPDLPLVTADPQLLDAALRALVRNAVEATGGSGVIRLCTGGGDAAVHVCVQDSGPGVAPEARGRAFEPFYTTRRAQAGLGLALVDKVARAHSGRAFLRSEPGSPTEAGLELPVRVG